MKYRNLRLRKVFVKFYSGSGAVLGLSFVRRTFARTKASQWRCRFRGNEIVN